MEKNYSIMTRIISSNNKSYPSSFMENCQFKTIFQPFKGFNLLNILSKGLTRPITYRLEHRLCSRNGEIVYQNTESVTITFCHQHLSPTLLKCEIKFVRVSIHVGSNSSYCRRTKSHKIPCPEVRVGCPRERFLAINSGEARGSV